MKAGVLIASIQGIQAGVIVALFAAVTVLGLLAGRWHKADLRQIDEWRWEVAGSGAFSLPTAEPRTPV